MRIDPGTQGLQALLSLACGTVLGFLYDLMNGFLRRLRLEKLLPAAYLPYSLLAAVLLFLLGSIAGRGQLRLFMLLGMLLGGSGAGKTTYVNAINGYEKADAKVMLNGRDVYKEYSKMQFECGFVPQSDLMRGKDTVQHTLMDYAALRLPSDFTLQDRKDRVEEALKLFGLGPVRNSMVSQLSGGQRKRLSIAMEFLSNPSLLILDEPDSGVDGVMAKELFKQMRKVADTGRIVIAITHTPDRVVDMFDDVIILAKDSDRTGRLAFYGTVDECRKFFGKERMEDVVKTINRPEEGGDGRADEFIIKYAQEVQHV